VYEEASLLKDAAETRLNDAETRLAHLAEAGSEATERILGHLDKICSSFNIFADRTAGLEALQQEAAQTNCDLQSIREGLERTENRIQAVGAQQVIWTGVSLAATATSVMGLMSIMFENKWQR
jgi:chemotaxis regulatin CheY-phosphate phosphatase CheZ